MAPGFIDVHTHDDAAVIARPQMLPNFMMDEADVTRILTSPEAMIGSDGLPEDSHPHPRLWGVDGRSKPSGTGLAVA